MTETTGAYDGGAIGARSGLMACTRVATTTGWRTVDSLAQGDMVLTFDAGLQRVTKVTRRPVWAGSSARASRFWQLKVPAGALGNREELTILPDQYVMIESDAGEDLFGDPFSLISARALEGVNGIKMAPSDRGLEAIVIHFESDQVIFAESGVLYYCPSVGGLMDQLVDTPGAAPYKALPAQDADVLVMCIESERSTGQIWAGSNANAPSYAMA